MHHVICLTVQEAVFGNPMCAASHIAVLHHIGGDVRQSGTGCQEEQTAAGQ